MSVLRRTRQHRCLLLGVVARANQRSTFANLKTTRQRLDAEHCKLIGMHPAIDRKVIARRLQVLTDGDDVGVARGSHIAQQLEHFVVMLANAEHDSCFRDQAARLELPEHRQ